MSKESKKTRYYDCACGRKVPLDGIKIMRHRKPGSSEYCDMAPPAVLTPAQGADKTKLAEKDSTGMVAIKCVFPPCTAQVMVKAPPEGVAVGTPQHMMKLGGIPMCPKHGEYLAFYIWAAINIKLQPQQTASGLVLPGNPNYNATVKQGPGAQDAAQEKSFIMSQRRPVK